MTQCLCFSLLFTILAPNESVGRERVEFVRCLGGGVKLQITARPVRFRPRSVRDEEQIEKLFAPFGWQLDRNRPAPPVQRLIASLVMPGQTSSELLWVRQLTGPIPGFDRGAFAVLGADFQDRILVVIYHNGAAICGDVASPDVAGFDMLTERPGKILDDAPAPPPNLLVDYPDIPPGSKWTAALQGRITDGSLRVLLSCPTHCIRANLRRTDEGLFWWEIEPVERATTRPSLR